MRLNRFFPLAVIVALLAGSSLLIRPGSTRADDFDDVRRGEVVVELQPGASIEAINARFGTSTITRIYGTNFYRLRVANSKKEKKWRKRLAKDPEVLSAALNRLVTSPSLFARATASFPEGFATPGLALAEFLSQQRLFESLNLEQVGLRSRGAGAVVAIIDTGVDRSHPALASRLWRNQQEELDGLDNDGDGLVDDLHGWNFADNNNDTNEGPDDPETTVAGHGTFIAGLVAMLAPECRIMPVRAFPASGISDAFTVAAAVKYAADHGADVINLSLGAPSASPLLEEAILDARKRGITLVAAVGNDGTESNPQFPSSLAEVIAVAAIELSGHKARFSNFGSHVDLCAPGDQLVSTFPGDPKGGYARWSGTSFAAPLVAAEAALVIAADPGQPDVKTIVESTAINIDDLNPGLVGKLGSGRIDPLAALKSLNSTIAVRTPADEHAQLELARGPAGGSAVGRATVTVKGLRQEFAVLVQGLDPRTSYRLVVDGAVVTSDVAASLGTLRFVLATDLGQPPLPPPINPVSKIRHVELRDSLNRLVLQGDFSGAGTAPVAGFVSRETRLVTTGALPQASGNAAVRIETLLDGRRRELLILTAEGLASDAGYRLLVNGTNVGGVLARSGFARLIMTSDGSSGQVLPPSLRPVTATKHIDLVDERGLIVLQGSFAAIEALVK
jgi:hypothetical protein